METKEKTSIRIEVNVNAPVEKAWECFNEPRHIVMWNQASDDWHSPKAENDLREGGRFNIRMEAKDGSVGFNFSGVYNQVVPYRLIEYTMDDNRKVKVVFEKTDNKTRVIETFEAEQTHSIEMQREGWQSILNNFRQYVEGQGRFKKMHHEILINASAEKVYRRMLDQQLYSTWTSVFNPKSRYEGSWEKGSAIRFIGESDDGKSGGMVSRIRENIPNRYVSIEHLGILKEGQEITTGSEVEEWAGALEDYTFKTEDGKTRVLVDVDVTARFEGYFDETWPKALNLLKQICETR